MASVYGDRFSDFYDGFDVWFYPESCFEIFKTWFSEYAKKKIKESMEIHKTVAPVLSVCEYKKRFDFLWKENLFYWILSKDKKRIKKICLALNIYKCPIVSGKTEFLVTGPNMGPSKIKSAQDRKIPIIAAERFIPEII